MTYGRADAVEHVGCVAHAPVSHGLTSSPQGERGRRASISFPDIRNVFKG
jgi:hypothetical protein